MSVAAPATYRSVRVSGHFSETDTYELENADSALLRRLRDGDASALEPLVERYWDPLVAYAANWLGCPDAAEDLAQEAFIRLWERRQSVECDRILGPFLYRIVRNLMLNEERRRKVRIRLRQQVGPQCTPTAPPTPLETLTERELRSAIERGINDLSPRRREVFLLARRNALSYQEIAERLDLSPQTVANQMSGALTSLRQSLGDYFDHHARIRSLFPTAALPPAGTGGAGREHICS